MCSHTREKPTEKDSGFSVSFACWGKHPNLHLSMMNHAAARSMNADYEIDTMGKVMISSPFFSAAAMSWWVSDELSAGRACLPVAGKGESPSASGLHAMPLVERNARASVVLPLPPHHLSIPTPPQNAPSAGHPDRQMGRCSWLMAASPEEMLASSAKTSSHETALSDYLPR